MPSAALSKVVCVAAMASAVAVAQITKAPEFEDPAFRTGMASASEGTSHVSAQGESVAENLLRHLAGFGSSDSPESAQFQQGYALLRQRMSAGAVALFRDAAARYPASVAIQCGLAVALHSAGNFDESAALLLQAAARHPRDVRLIPLLGETARSSPPNGAAFERRLREFVRVSPGGAVRYFLAQLIASRQPEAPQEAIELWTEAARLDPRDARPCLELARAEAFRDRIEEAIMWYGRALERDPASAEAHYQLARLCLRTGRREVGERHMKQFQALRDKAAAKQ